MRLAFQAVMPRIYTLNHCTLFRENEIVQGTKQVNFILKMIHIYHINCVENVKKKYKDPKYCYHAEIITIKMYSRASLVAQW